MSKDTGKRTLEDEIRILLGEKPKGGEQEEDKDMYKKTLKDQINILLGKKLEEGEDKSKKKPEEQSQMMPGKKPEEDKQKEEEGGDMRWVRVLPTAIEKTGPDFLQVVTADDTFDRAPLALKAGASYQLQVLSHYAFEMFQEILGEIGNLRQKLNGINGKINDIIAKNLGPDMQTSQETRKTTHTEVSWTRLTDKWEQKKEVMQELRKRDQRIQCLKEMEELMTQFRRLRIQKLQRKSLDDSVDQAMPVRLVNKFCEFVFPFRDPSGAKVKLDPETKVQFEMTRRWSGLNTSRERATPDDDKDEDLETCLQNILDLPGTIGDERRVL